MTLWGERKALAEVLKEQAHAVADAICNLSDRLTAHGGEYRHGCHCGDCEAQRDGQAAVAALEAAVARAETRVV